MADDQGTGASPGWKVGTVAGIPLYVGGGWVVIAIVMIAVFGPQVGDFLPEIGLLAYAVAAGYALLLLVSVLVHEAAHAVVARACGYGVHRVVVDLMGGHTAYDSSHATPGRSALVAVVGPLSNGLLAVLAWQALPLVHGDVARLLVGALAWTNGFVAAFNLLPGLPLDGGFLLDSLVWRVTGRRHLGLLAAGWSGRLLTVAVLAWAVGLPFVRGEYPSLFTMVWAGLVGAFLWAGASQAIATGRLRGSLRGLDLRRLVHDVVTVGAQESLRDVPPLPPGGGAVVVTDETGRPVGFLDGAGVREAAQAGDLDARVDSCLRGMPPDWVLEVPRSARDVTSVLDAMVERRVPVLALVDGGECWGVVDGEAIEAALARGREEGATGT